MKKSLIKIPLGKGLDVESGMERQIKGILQSYVERMNGNRLTIENELR